MKSEFLNLLSLGSERAVADLMVAGIDGKPDRFALMLDFCFIEEYPTSMRAARVIQLCCEKDPGLIEPHLGYVIEKVLATKIDGVKRNFLKIIAEFIDINLVEDPGPLLERCFSWLVDAHENPAIRIYAMDIIQRIAIKEPDLLYELRAILEYLPDENPPSIQNRKQRLLKKLGRAK